MAGGDHVVGGWQTYAVPGWDDLRFPLIGRNLDTASGRIDYDFTELGVEFAANSRYAATEQISFICQAMHAWKFGTDWHPHLHWMQTRATIPNWILNVRGPYDIGDAAPAWAERIWSSHAVAWSSGTIHQLTSFPIIDMSAVSGVSSIVDIKLFRDVSNASGLFTGAESSPIAELAKEFDIHFQSDSRGSRSEYVK